MSNQGTETVSFTVDGMGCGGCASGIATTLQGTQGVRQAEVTFETRQATIAYDPARTTADELSEIIRGEGYTVTPSAS